MPAGNPYIIDTGGGFFSDIVGGYQQAQAQAAQQERADKLAGLQSQVYQQQIQAGQQKQQQAAAKAGQLKEFRQFRNTDEYDELEAAKRFPLAVPEIKEWNTYTTELRERGGQKAAAKIYNLAKTGNREGLEAELENNRGLIDTLGDQGLTVDTIKAMDADQIARLATGVYRQSGGNVEDLTGKTQKTKTVDLGDRVAIVDGQGNTIRELSKGAGPQANKPMSVHLQKRLSDSSDLAISSQSAANEYEALAGDFEKLNVGGGAIAKWEEAYKDQTGQQDAISNLRRRWNSVRSSEVAKNLPPGAASDTDIALALSGFPSDRATGTQISSFLRGLAKIENRRADFNNFKSEYISKNRHERDLLAVWKDRQEREEEEAQRQAETPQTPPQQPPQAVAPAAGQPPAQPGSVQGWSDEQIMQGLQGA